MPDQRGPRADTLLQSVTVAVGLAIVCRFVALGRGVFLARTLEPEELGKWALLANAIQVLAFVCAWGIPNSLARYTDRFHRQGTLGRFYAGAIARTLAVAALVSLVGLVFWRPTAQLLFADSASRSMVWITLFAVLATVLLTLTQGMLHGLRLFRANSLFDLGQNLAFLAVAVLLLALWRSDAYAAAWANLATTLLVAGGIGWWLRRTFSSDGVSDKVSSPGDICWWPILAYSLGAWSAGSFQALWRVIDRYMLLHLSTADTAETLDHIGQYFIASKLGQPLGALAGVLSMVLLPHAVKMWERNRRGDVAQLVSITAKLAALLMTFGGAVLIVCKKPLIELVIGRTATLASTVFVPVLITVIAVSLHYILRTYLMCNERAWAVSGVWLATLVANAVLNVLFIPRFGLLGAAWATMISAGLAVALVTILAARSGMPIGLPLVLHLLLPGMLLLPPMAMLMSLSLVAPAVLYSELLFRNVEKRWINQWCADRLGAMYVGRVGRILAPEPT